MSLVSGAGYSTMWEMAHEIAGDVFRCSVLSRLVLPLPPSVNHCYRRCGKITFKTEIAKQWQEQAKFLARKWYRGPMCKDKIVLNIWVFWNDGRKRDVDNIMKLLLDSLTGIVWVDDYYCLPRVQNWEIDRGNGRVEVSIEKLAE